MSATSNSLRFMAAECEGLNSDQAALLVRAADQIEEIERLREALKDIATRAAAHVYASIPANG